MPSLEQQLKQIAKKLQPKIQDALKYEVAETVTETLLSHVKQDVYDVYQPKSYERRYDDGGLADEGNIKSTVKGNTLIVENTTMSNEDYLPKKKKPYKIAGSIEYGTGYDYYSPGERPFIESTREDLRQNKQHISAMGRGLKRQGIDIKDSSLIFI